MHKKRKASVMFTVRYLERVKWWSQVYDYVSSSELKTEPEYKDS
jgi:hypothetical protein